MAQKKFRQVEETLQRSQAQFKELQDKLAQEAATPMQQDPPPAVEAICQVLWQEGDAAQILAAMRQALQQWRPTGNKDADAPPAKTPETGVGNGMKPPPQEPRERERTPRRHREKDDQSEDEKDILEKKRREDSERRQQTCGPGHHW